MRAASDRALRLKRLEDGRAYSLAQLVAFAVNDPKHMPSFEKVFPSGKRRSQSADEIWEAMKGWADMAAEGRDG